MSRFLVPWESPCVVQSMGAGEGLGIRGNEQLFWRSVCSIGVSILEDAVEEQGEGVKEGAEAEPLGECCCSTGLESLPEAPSEGNAWVTGVRSGSGVIGNVEGTFFGVLYPNATLSRSRSSSRAFTAARFVEIGPGFVFLLSQSARYAAHVSKCLPF